MILKVKNRINLYKARKMIVVSTIKEQRVLSKDHNCDGLAFWVRDVIARDGTAFIIEATQLGEGLRDGTSLMHVLY